MTLFPVCTDCLRAASAIADARSDRPHACVVCGPPKETTTGAGIEVVVSAFGEYFSRLETIARVAASRSTYPEGGPRAPVRVGGGLQ